MMHASIFKSCRRRVFLLWLYLLLAAAEAFPSAPEIDCNTCCRFPLSLGVEYQRLSPFAAYGSRYYISDLSAAMPSCCVGQPVGTVAITNTEKHPVKEVVVAFMLSGCMDSPTRAASLAELKAGETKKSELFASFNQEVFSTEGVTPLTGEVVVSYKSKGKAAEQRRSFTYDRYDKTAVTWDGDQKTAAFMTPADSARINLANVHNLQPILPPWRASWKPTGISSAEEKGNRPWV